MAQKQHVAYYRKVLLRKHMLRRWAKAGDVYVPFIGDGDLAVDCYKDRYILGADLDPARVAVASDRGLNAIVKEADCDYWPFRGHKATFAVADFDAYTYPYHSFRAFWANADKKDRLVLFFTDTVKQAIKRMGQIHEPDGSKPPVLPDVATDLSRARTWHYNFWFSKHILPWFEEYVVKDGWIMLDYVRYLRQDTVYWGAAIEKSQR